MGDFHGQAFASTETVEVSGQRNYTLQLRKIVFSIQSDRRRGWLREQGEWLMKPQMRGKIQLTLPTTPKKPWCLIHFTQIYLCAMVRPTNGIKESNLRKTHGDLLMLKLSGISPRRQATHLSDSSPTGSLLFLTKHRLRGMKDGGT